MDDIDPQVVGEPVMAVPTPITKVDIVVKIDQLEQKFDIMADLQHQSCSEHKLLCLMEDIISIIWRVRHKLRHQL